MTRAERIQAAPRQSYRQGVRAVEDPALIGYLVEHAIPLEVCPMSNVRLGLYAGLADHPLSALHAAGVSRGSFLPADGKAALVAACQVELDMLKHTPVPGG